MAYARSAAAISHDFAVFPSTEAALLEARGGAFAGCISATANLNADLCARAWRDGDAAALDAAVAIRKLFDGKPLVSGVKALLAHIHGDPALARVKPPLAAFLGRRPRRGHRRLRRGPGQTGGLNAAFSRALTPARGLTISLAGGGELLAAAFSVKDRSLRRALRAAGDRCQRESHGQYQVRPQSHAQDRAPDRNQQGAPLGAAQFGPQGRGSDRQRRPHCGRWRRSRRPSRSSCVRRSAASCTRTMPAAKCRGSRIASPSSASKSRSVRAQCARHSHEISSVKSIDMPPAARVRCRACVANSSSPLSENSARR